MSKITRVNQDKQKPLEEYRNNFYVRTINSMFIAKDYKIKDYGADSVESLCLWWTNNMQAFADKHEDEKQYWVRVRNTLIAWIQMKPEQRDFVKQCVISEECDFRGEWFDVFERMVKIRRKLGDKLNQEAKYHIAEFEKQKAQLDENILNNDIP